MRIKPFLITYQFPPFPLNLSALDLAPWTSGCHLARYDWSSYHLTTTLCTLNIYRSTDTPPGGREHPHTWKWFQLITNPLWQDGRGGGGIGEEKEGEGVVGGTKEHFSGVIATVCNEQQKGHLTHFCQNEFICFKHLILQSPHWCAAWQCTQRVHYHKWRLSFQPLLTTGLWEWLKSSGDSEAEGEKSTSPLPS